MATIIIDIMGDCEDINDEVNVDIDAEKIKQAELAKEFFIRHQTQLQIIEIE